MGAIGSSLRNAILPERSHEFTLVYESIFSPEANPLSVEEMLTKLNLLSRIDSSFLTSLQVSNVPRRRLKMKRVHLYQAIAQKLSCSSLALKTRVNMEDQYESHPNLGPFLKHFNEIVFTECAYDLNEILKTKLSLYERLENLAGALNVIRSKRRQHPLVSNRFGLKALTQGTLEFMASKGFDPEKPRHRSMHEHSLLLSRIINVLIADECMFLHENEREHLQRFTTMRYYDSQLDGHFDSEVWERYLDKYLLCISLSDVREYIYSLAGDTFLRLRARIVSHPSPGEPVMEPEQTAELLDMSLFSAQAELAFFDELLINQEMVKTFIDLMQVSQIRSSKCNLNYVRSINSLIEDHANELHLIRYLNHYGRLQAAKCARDYNPGLGIANQLTALTDSQKNEIKTLKIETESARSDLGLSQIKLHLEIPDEVFVLGFEKYLEKRGLKKDDDIVINLERIIRLLGEPCRNLLESMQPSAQYLGELIKFDTGPRSIFNPESLNSIVNYKLCLKILVE